MRFLREMDLVERVCFLSAVLISLAVVIYAVYISTHCRLVYIDDIFLYF